ncbi:hypothetical protein ASD68_02975 [Rhodanobacter sp. Root627]|nr:hypothetical protein ASD68_02975 [Rhodanobacter sp. Root627]
MDQESPFMRARIEKYVRIVLIVMSILAVSGPVALGVGMMFITLIFCDSGPIQKCAEVGVMFLGGFLFCAALPVPALIALFRNKNSLGWYLHVYPLLMLVLAFVAYHISASHSLGVARFGFEYACLALVAFAHVALRYTDVEHDRPANGPSGIPPAR